MAGRAVAEVHRVADGRCRVILDGVEHRYHVRERDNRVAIVLTQRPELGDYWYVSVEDLKDSKWTFREGSCYPGGVTHERALKIGQTYYDREAQR